MSYILDALKKSEAERSNRERPELAHRVPFTATPEKKREIWPYLLITLALMANVFVIAYLMWPESASNEDQLVHTEGSPETSQQSSEVASSPEVPEAPTIASADTSANVDQRAASEKPSETASQEPSMQQAGRERQEQQPTQAEREPPKQPEPQELEEQLASASPATTPGEVPTIHSMPQSVQRRVPKMTFNAHLHSSNPSSRRVMINNRMLREGDRVGRLAIDEITPAGVVFRLDGHVFQIDVVRDW